VPLVSSRAPFQLEKSCLTGTPRDDKYKIGTDISLSAGMTKGSMNPFLIEHSLTCGINWRLPVSIPT